MHRSLPPSFAIFGAGAVGCYFGALLARAGYPLQLIGRAAHVQAIAAHGLRLQTATEDVHIPLAASTEARTAAQANVVLLCVKATDTESAAQQLAPHLRPGAVVLCLQNGVDNAERVRAVLGPAHPVWPAVVYVATAMAGPGHVQHLGRCELVLPDASACAAIAPWLQQAGIAVALSDQVAGTLWAKLVVNCAYNALSAIVQQPYGWLLQQDGAPALLAQLVAECQAVAQAEGVPLPADLPARVQAIAQTMPAQKSSTAQDLARGRESEIEHLNGYVVRRAADHGLTAPANQALLVLVRMLQARQKLFN